MLILDLHPEPIPNSIAVIYEGITLGTIHLHECETRQVKMALNFAKSVTLVRSNAEVKSPPPERGLSSVEASNRSYDKATKFSKRTGKHRLG